MFDRPLYKKIALQQLKGRWATAVLVTLAATAIMGILSAAIQYAELPPPLLIAIGLMFCIMNMASAKFFITMSRTPAPVPFSEWTAGFGLWAKAILTYLWMALWVFLWSLLFYIPGIVKAIAYSFTPYIVAEKPDISVRKALVISKTITSGYKMDLFVLQLSFLGWMLLAVLTGGIGMLWLEPYMELSYINAFHDIKKQALERGIVRESDFA